MSSEIQPIWFALPVLAAGIGWATNYIAVKMLLRPVKPRKILGITFQGAIPKRQKEIAAKVSGTVAQDFLTSDDLENLLKDARMDEVLRTELEKKWDEQIGGLIDSIPMVSMFLSADKIEGIKTKVMNGIVGENGEGLHALVESVANRVELEEYLKAKLEAFDLDRLEGIVENIARKEFRFVERLGGLIGFIIGWIQVGIMAIS